MVNFWKDIEPGKNPPDEVNLVVEIPKGSRNKIEIEKGDGTIRLDRVLHKPFKFVSNYGFIPQTYYEDGDAADGLLVMEETLPAGTIVSVRPVGLMRFVDSGEQDDKIISVAAKDPDFKEVRDISDLPKDLIDEIKEFYSNYKKPEGKTTEVKGFEGVAAAKEFILKSIQLYKEKFGGE
jgi:inorganic pyrophosphatase